MELTIKQALQKAAVLYKQGDIKEAEILYRNILIKFPSQPFANYNLGLILETKQQNEWETKINIRQNKRLWIMADHGSRTLSRHDRIS